MNMCAGNFRRWLNSPAVVVPALIVGFWPVWIWYVARMTDGSDEPLGLLALVAAVVFLPRAGWRTGRPAAWWGATAAIVGLYATTFPFTPLLVRAALAVTALAIALPSTPGTSPVPRWALLLLSLPVIASLQFYFGFPLRAATAWCTANVLTLAGVAVQARGTVLTWAGGDVLLDAPCSGIRMLWMAMFLSATLAAWHRLPAGRCVRLASGTSTLVFGANLARSVVLFFLETAQWPNPPGAHEGVGLVAFALVVAGCAWWAHRLVRPGEVPRQGYVVAEKRAWVAVVVLCAAGGAAVRPVWSGETAPRGDGETAVDWPTCFEGHPLAPVALHPFEARLARDFPGAIAAFTDGERRIIFRQVRQATRKVHAIADCLRASGYDVHPVSARRDDDHNLWASLEARKDGGVLFLRERFSDARGQTWTDVSAWYWAAALHPHAGPWWSVVVLASTESADGSAYASSSTTGQ